MVTEEQKYMAQFFQISGFCCMTPFARLILKLLDTEPFDLSLRFFVVFLISALLFIWGIILVLKGLERVEERRLIR